VLCCAVSSRYSIEVLSGEELSFLASYTGDWSGGGRRELFTCLHGYHDLKIADEKRSDGADGDGRSSCSRTTYR
jgi:hypothetical protein